MKGYPEHHGFFHASGLIVLMLLGGQATAAESRGTVLQGFTPSSFELWKNGVPPADFKAAHLGIGTEWRGVRPRRSRRPDDQNQTAEIPNLQPASPSGRVPGDGGFAGVHFTAEEPRVIDLAPWNAITVGATQDSVRHALGEPSVRLPLKWYYPAEGWLAFDASGKVVDFSRPTPPRSREPVRLHPLRWAQLHSGMSKAEIARQLGEPEIKLNYKWFYGPDRWIAFDNDGTARGWGESKI